MDSPWACDELLSISGMPGTAVNFSASLRNRDCNQFATAARPDSNLAIGTLNGEQET